MIKDQTILLLHGANSVGNEWVNFENEFKKLGNKVVKPILRHHSLGFNGSEKLGNTSIFDYVADIEETIKKLKQKPIIIGHSMGGLIALILCSRGYGKLGIFITPAAPKGINAITFSVLKIFFRNLFRWKFWSKPIPPNFPAAFYGVFHDFDRNRAFNIFNRSCSAESGRALCEIGFPYFFSPSPTDINAEGIKCPTLIIGAGRDRITPVQISKKLKKKLGERSELIIFQKFSHYIMEGKEFSTIFEYILKWIKKNKFDL